MFHCEEVFSLAGGEVHKKWRNGEKQQTISFLFARYHFLLLPRFSFLLDLVLFLHRIWQNRLQIQNLFLIVTFALVQQEH